MSNTLFVSHPNRLAPSFLLVLISLGLMSTLPVFAQDIFLSSPAKVDALASSGIDSIKGNLVIDDHESSSKIFSLTALTKLRFIGGDLIIITSELKFLDGLDHITSIGGSLWLFDNGALRTVSSLSGLLSVGKSLVIENNYSLLNINGLSGIPSLEGEVFIKHNDHLKNLDGLSNLSSVGDRFVIDLNPELEDIDGLSNLSNVDGELWIGNNEVLNTCCGLFPLFCLDPPNCNTDGVSGLVTIVNNGNRCTAGSILVGGSCLITAIEELKHNAVGIDLYPNPTNAKLIVNLNIFANAPALIRILDSFGKLFWQKHIRNIDQTKQLTIDLKSISEITDGLYFISVIHKGEVYTKKFIVSGS